MAFDDIYGNRMGNRPGTNDGSTYIGRGGPQITGRDGYEQVGRRIGVDLVKSPTRACDHDLQPDICAAFWSWKNMNRFADNDDFHGCVKAWNGGTKGLKDRQKHLARITKILQGAEWGKIAALPLVVNKPPPDDTQSPLSSTGDTQPTPQPLPKTETPTSFWAKLAKIFRG